MNNYDCFLLLFLQVLTALSLFWMQEAVTDLSEVPSTDLFGEMFDQVEAEELSQRPKKRAKNQIGETIYKESSAISRRCLIVCPTTLIGHWSSEASSFLNISPSTQAKDECMKLSVIELKGSSQDIKTILKESMDDSVNKIFIASYNTLRSHIETLSLLLFDVIVLDEGHIITNRNSKVHHSPHFALFLFLKLFCQGVKVRSSVARETSAPLIRHPYTSKT